MVSPLYLKSGLIFVCVISIILLSGCTEQENKEFGNAIKTAVVNAAECKVGLGSNCSNESVSIEVNVNKGECRFDSDCSSICDGNVFWKRGCDPQSDTCVKTFETDCSVKTTDIGNYSFPMLCTVTGCIDDTSAIHAQKEDLIAQVNTYTAAMQQTTTLRQIASRNCINGLAEVTNKLIIDTAVSFSSLPTNMVAIYSDTTKQAIDTIGSAAGGSNTMSAEEFISLNCNAIKALDSDFALISKKRDILSAEANAFQGQ